MRSSDDIYQDLEGDRLQREGEIRLIENFAAVVKSDAERNMLFRSLVLLNYAHLEGFCKFALFAYTGAINALALPCKEAVFPIVAASLGQVFAALRNLDSKAPEFRGELPDDKDLHMLWRERKFIEDYEFIVGKIIDIPDRVVDTKANLNSRVLKRNLYQLGLEYPLIDQHRTTIDKLLGVRNAIAHGDALKIPKADEVKEYTESVFEVMRFVQNIVFSSLRDKSYKRPKLS